MSKFLKFTLAAGFAISATAVFAGEFGLGRPALPEEIAAWDVKVMPDGRGLPEGSGDVWTGDEVFSENCAVCHGDFAEGVGNWPKLAGGWDTLDHEDPLKTVGSYWPYLSTVWDYVNRSMPFGNAQSLSADEVYAITAYILYSNNLVDEDFTLSHENFTEVEMPNADGFIVDDRAETEYPKWTGEPCMENCKEEVKITMRARVLDVTPDVEEAEAAPVEAEPVAVAVAEPEPAPEPEVAAVDPALIEAGEKVFKKCKACHQVGEGAKDRAGPQLNGVMGRAAGSVEGFKYSKALKAKADEGLVWNEETISAFLANPRGYMKGTKMGFAGLKSEEDQAAIAAYLSSFAD
ncbi:sulfur dehydrogenase subunit SoxD [Roseovarius marisflavi]|uniref:Sulfur dehydrogenase subunit SoxD n=1 Tax=Roseovarius marisflavi TaxID=1054996 RepID=A0A1M6XFI3_9RHOB|nr:c-type cytochrome [Roseovarius marisflavi]SHL04780.1 sulfur dehydrogenase subunit SoxD [Roseovarius marisflavi]